MEIRVRRNNDYGDIKISHDNTVIDLGLYDKEELKELLDVFENASDDLRSLIN